MQCPSGVAWSPKTKLSENRKGWERKNPGPNENLPELSENTFESVCENVCGSAVSLGSYLIIPKQGWVKIIKAVRGKKLFWAEWKSSRTEWKKTFMKVCAKTCAAVQCPSGVAWSFQNKAEWKSLKQIENYSGAEWKSSRPEWKFSRTEWKTFGPNESVCEDVCGSAVSLGSCLITPTLLVHSHFHNWTTWDEDEDDHKELWVGVWGSGGPAN